jgi:hypothetical protein
MPAQRRQEWTGHKTLTAAFETQILMQWIDQAIFFPSLRCKNLHLHEEKISTGFWERVNGPANGTDFFAKIFHKIVSMIRFIT